MLMVITGVMEHMLMGTIDLVPMHTHMIIIHTLGLLTVTAMATTIPIIHQVTTLQAGTPPHITILGGHTKIHGQTSILADLLIMTMVGKTPFQQKR